MSAIRSFTSLAAVLGLGACGADGDTWSTQGLEGARSARDAAVCTPGFAPSWQQATGANSWWVEYAIGGGNITEASLEVPGRGAVPLSSAWGKWVGPTGRIDPGTPVVLHARDDLGRAAESEPFGYLVVFMPTTAACSGAAAPSCGAGYAPALQQGPGANNWWAEYFISGAVSAHLEVLAGGAVPLSLAWGKWGGASAAFVPTGASVRLHATDAQGRTARSSAFAYLVDTQPRAESGCATATTTPTSPPPPAPPPTPPPPSAGADLVLRVDAGAAGRSISPLIYGTNSVAAARRYGSALTLVRASGNRYSTYNWENNASNAGEFWFHANDGVYDLDGQPAAPAREAIDAGLAIGGSALVTIPTMGWVSADTSGPVAYGEPRSSRFHPSLANKGAPLAASPDLFDGVVYQDELVSYLSARYPHAFQSSPPRVLFCLDNEPELWRENFSRAYFDPPRIGTILENNVTFASMVKRVQPSAFVVGPVLYGWDGFLSFQGAVDRDEPQYRGRTFVEIYLATMRSAAGPGRRLLDALDIHWYPEARGDGLRIIGPEASAGVVQARLQAPRSLWDATYVEDSWITRDSTGGAPIRLLPWLDEIIARAYPGTPLVVSEYNYGGWGHVSGAIAEADVLGIFGRHGVFAANLFELDESGSPYLYAGLAMYRSYDGAGGRFGDRSVPAQTSDATTSSIYAAIDSQAAGRLTLVVINKSGAARLARLEVAGGAYRSASIYVLTGEAPQPRAAGTLSGASDGSFSVTLPPLSVSTLVLRQ